MKFCVKEDINKSSLLRSYSSQNRRENECYRLQKTYNAHDNNQIT